MYTRYRAVKQDNYPPVRKNTCTNPLPDAVEVFVKQYLELKLLLDDKIGCEVLLS